MTIMVKCKKCGNEIVSPIQMDESSFKMSTLENNSTDCPKCNNIFSFDKKDMYFK